MLPAGVGEVGEDAADEAAEQDEDVSVEDNFFAVLCTNDHSVPVSMCGHGHKCFFQQQLMKLIVRVAIHFIAIYLKSATKTLHSLSRVSLLGNWKIVICRQIIG